MSLIVYFQHNIHHGDVLRTVSSWNKEFPNTHEGFDLMLGYFYALTLLRGFYDVIEVIINSIRYLWGDFMQQPSVQRMFLGTITETPHIDEKFSDFNHRVRLLRLPAFQYIIVVHPRGRPGTVSYVQFNHVTFLQGFLSVFRGFNVPTIRYIYTIYGLDDAQYTFRLD